MEHGASDIKHDSIRFWVIKIVQCYRTRCLVHITGKQDLLARAVSLPPAASNQWALPPPPHQTLYRLHHRLAVSLLQKKSTDFIAGILKDQRYIGFASMKLHGLQLQVTAAAGAVCRALPLYGLGTSPNVLFQLRGALCSARVFAMPESIKAYNFPVFVQAVAAVITA